MMALTFGRTIARPARRHARALALLAAAVALAPARHAHAQGSLSAQGYGYPTGALSTRALGTGGAIGEFDPASPINPATIGWLGRMTFAFQYDPEFRRVSTGSTSQSATLTRFPVISIGIPVRERGFVGFSASTYLDRTFNARHDVQAQVGPDLVAATERVESRGSISDLRLAYSYAPVSRVRVGIGGHLLTGQNQLVSGRVFADTSRFGTVADSSTLDFTGLAASVGAEWRIVKGLSVAGSYRVGGTMRVARSDTTLRQASAPDRAGVGVRFDRIPGASIAASYSTTSWSRMRGLVSDSVTVNDAPDLGVGIEALGPRIGDNPLLLRLGGRRRTLPFAVRGAEVQETAYAGGLGAPFAGGRAVLDVSLQYARRTASGGVAGALGDAVRAASERATTVSIGFSVRP